MKKIVITGFDPFGGQSVSPAWEAVNALPDQIGNRKLCKLQIPTVFGLAADTILARAKEIHADIILCIGQAGGRSAVTPERIAVNIRDGKIADNAGFQPDGEPVAADGPAAYFTTLPVAAMVAAIQAAGIPSLASNSAGAFVCNDTLYALLHHYSGTPVKVGFIHVPYLPEQGSPSLPLTDIVKALEAAISAL
jgi:pyroglutamyl-peptidase